jgi:hypothetical protein
MKYIIAIGLLLFILLPLSNLLSVFCTSFMIKRLGGKANKLRMGSGKLLFRLGEIEIRAIYFNSYHYEWVELLKPSKWKQIMIHSTGILAKVLLIFLLTFVYQVYAGELLLTIIMLSIYLVLLEIIPYKTKDVYSEGQQIVDILKTGVSKMPRKEDGSYDSSEMKNSKSTVTYIIVILISAFIGALIKHYLLS